jgi:hypothetical protein
MIEDGNVSRIARHITQDTCALELGGRREVRDLLLDFTAQITDPMTRAVPQEELRIGGWGERWLLLVVGWFQCRDIQRGASISSLARHDNPTHNHPTDRKEDRAWGRVQGVRGHVDGAGGGGQIL